MEAMDAIFIHDFTAARVAINLERGRLPTLTPTLAARCMHNACSVYQTTQNIIHPTSSGTKERTNAHGPAFPLLWVLSCFIPFAMLSRTRMMMMCGAELTCYAAPRRTANSGTHRLSSVNTELCRIYVPALINYEFNQFSKLKIFWGWAGVSQSSPGAPRDVSDLQPSALKESRGRVPCIGSGILGDLGGSFSSRQTKCIQHHKQPNESPSPPLQSTCSRSFIFHSSIFLTVQSATQRRICGR